MHQCEGVWSSVQSHTVASIKAYEVAMLEKGRAAG